MTDHLSRIRDALDRYSQSNRAPAVEEPQNDFEVAVNDWADNKELVDEIKKLLKPLEAEERRQRESIAVSLASYFGADHKEGVNTYELSNGRNLKYTRKVSRSVEVSMIPAAREAYNAIAGGAGTTAFDDLLRTKYELQVTPFRKLGPEEANAVSRMIVSKPAAPTLEVD